MGVPARQRRHRRRDRPTIPPGRVVQTRAAGSHAATVTRCPVLGISVGTWTARRRVRRAPLGRIGHVSHGPSPGAGWGPSSLVTTPATFATDTSARRGRGATSICAVPAGWARPLVRSCSVSLGPPVSRPDRMVLVGRGSAVSTRLASPTNDWGHGDRDAPQRCTCRSARPRSGATTSRGSHVSVGPPPVPKQLRAALVRRSAVEWRTPRSRGWVAARLPARGPAPRPTVSCRARTGPGRRDRPHGRRAHHPLARWRRGRRDPRAARRGAWRRPARTETLGACPPGWTSDGIAWRCHALGAGSGRLPVVVRLRAPIAPTVPPRSPVAPPTVEERASRSGDKHPCAPTHLSSVRPPASGTSGSHPPGGPLERCCDEAPATWPPSPTMSHRLVDPGRVHASSTGPAVTHAPGSATDRTRRSLAPARSEVTPAPSLGATRGPRGQGGPSANVPRRRSRASAAPCARRMATALSRQRRGRRDSALTGREPRGVGCAARRPVGGGRAPPQGALRRTPIRHRARGLLGRWAAGGGGGRARRGQMRRRSRPCRRCAPPETGGWGRRARRAARSSRRAARDSLHRAVHDREADRRSLRGVQCE
jgi:hypothetical protein